jgi:hypothetical protein
VFPCDDLQVIHVHLFSFLSSRLRISPSINYFTKILLIWLQMFNYYNFLYYCGLLYYFYWDVLLLSVRNQNLIQEEIKRRLNSGNACYHSVQNLLSSQLLSKTLKIRIYETIVLPLVLYGCETWPLILKEKAKLTLGRNIDWGV